MADITCEAFSELEDDVQQEFYEDVVSAIDDINQCVNLLEGSVDDETDDGVIDRIFRAIHTVKGNCNMVFLKDFVDATHRLEDLFSAVRAKDIDYHPVYGLLAMKIVNLVQIELKSLIEQKFANGDILEKIQSLLEQVESASQESSVEITTKAITAIDDGHFSIALIEGDSIQGSSFSFLESTDFEFLEYLSSRVQNTSEYHTTYYKVAKTLAFKLNQMLSNKADEQQLDAALIALHLSQRIESSGQSSTLTLQQVIFSHGLLSRMSGWGAAATLCLQVLESHNGDGMPLAISGDDIQPAAQVLGLSCEFSFHVLNAENREYKQSLFTAVKAINAEKNIRFKDRLVERFTSLIKSEYLSSKMF
ncbi:MAG: chemotaxis protein histidine kinase CheA [Polaribacter sp.]